MMSRSETHNDWWCILKPHSRRKRRSTSRAPLSCSGISKETRQSRWSVRSAALRAFSRKPATRPLSVSATTRRLLSRLISMNFRRSKCRNCSLISPSSSPRLMARTPPMPSLISTIDMDRLDMASDASAIQSMILRSVLRVFDGFIAIFNIHFCSGRSKVPVVFRRTSFPDNLGFGTASRKLKKAEGGVPSAASVRCESALAQSATS